jgi:hypothetical protein
MLYIYYSFFMYIVLSQIMFGVQDSIVQLVDNRK